MKEEISTIVRLNEAVEKSCQDLSFSRKKRVDMIREYVGAHYSENGSEKVVPTNFLELAVTIYLRLLAARAPRVIVTTESLELRPFAKNTEIVLNQVPEEIDLSETLQEAVMEAFFGFAVVKVGIANQGKTKYEAPYAEPFVDMIQIDDYFCDMTAKSWRKIQFEGNDYWLSLKDVESIYHVKLEADEYNATSTQGDTEAKGVGVENPNHSLEDKAHLRDVYICSSGRIITYAVKSLTVLRDEPFDGPEGTPYIHLGFTKVPGNLLPLPPATLWYDLHTLGNTLFRKLARQADSKKSVAAFAGGNDDGVQSLQKASDGDGIAYSGSKPETISIGGVDAPTLAFYLQTRDLFSYFAGNLDSLGGLSPQAETLGQDKLLSEAANARVNGMSEAVVDFSKKIFKRLAWYVWTDPVRERTYHKTVNGASGFSIKKKWTPETRDGEFLDYNFSIDVYSMQDDSPSTRIQKFGMVFERFLMPLMPMLQEQGAYIDIVKVCEFLSKNAALPELDELVKFSQSKMEEGPVRGNSTPEATSFKPASTTRRYERVNRPGGTRSGNDNALSKILMGGKIQESEANTVGRGVS